MGRDHDKWLMLELKCLGLAKQELKRLNRVRIHYQVLFLSDILGASGKHLDKKYLAPKDPAEKWSKFNFPRERPPMRGIRLWWRMLRQLVPSVGIADRLRLLGPEFPKVLDWRWGSMLGRLAQLQDKIGWRRFMEGMVSRVTVEIQQVHYNLWQVKRSTGRWAQGLVTQLTEITHGRWM